jgi:hypothetical protein
MAIEPTIPSRLAGNSFDYQGEIDQLCSQVPIISPQHVRGVCRAWPMQVVQQIFLIL